MKTWPCCDHHKTNGFLSVLTASLLVILRQSGILVLALVYASSAQAGTYTLINDTNSHTMSGGSNFQETTFDATYYRGLHLTYQMDMTGLFAGWCFMMICSTFNDDCNGNIYNSNSVGNISVPGTQWETITADLSSNCSQRSVTIKFTYNIAANTAYMKNIVLTGIKDAPTATSQSATVNENSSTGYTSLNINDPQGASMTAHVTSGPSHGSLAWSGTQFNYTPTSCYYGSDSFSYNVTENIQGQASSTATVTLTVNKVNFSPTISAISAATIPWYTQANVNMTGIAAGTCGGTISVSATSSNTSVLPNPSVTYASPSSTGTLTMTPVRPVTGQTGTSTITVTVNDGVNNSVQTSFTASVPWVALIHR